MKAVLCIYTVNVPATNPRSDLAKISRVAHGGLVAVAEAARALGIAPAAAASRLGALKRRGWLRHVRRGLFLIVPLEAEPASGATVEDAWVLGKQLFAPCYIGGWSAAEHWGLTEQIFRSVFVASGAHVRRSQATFLGAEFRVVKIPRRRIEGASAVWRGRERVLVSDRELTIADALIAPDWVGGFRHLAQIIRTCYESKEWNSARLIARMEHLGKGAGFKRLGWLFEQIFPTETDLITLCFHRRSAGLIAVDPRVKATGRISKRWGLRINVSLDDR
jgi:predicted transcriptional regulator of viral defense system